MRYIFVGMIVFFVLLAIVAYYETSGEQEDRSLQSLLIKQRMERMEREKNN